MSDQRILTVCGKCLDTGKTQDVCFQISKYENNIHIQIKPEISITLTHTDAWKLVSILGEFFSQKE
jgi:hypothetical protein